MRALHLFFRLHRPYQLKPLDEIKSGYFGGEAEFREADRTMYQPFLALMERNAQKYPNFKVTLSISGLFLEQAEAWDSEIIRRLRRLVKNGHVQLTVEPYDYSLAMFYNQDEFEKQIERHKTKLEQLFGGDLLVLALPELLYNDRLATWADKAGYQGIIAGAADKILDWRNTSQLYSAAGCKKVKVMFQNTLFSRAIMTGNEDFLMVEEAVKPVDFQTTEDSARGATVVTRRRMENKLTAADFVEAMTHKVKRSSAAMEDTTERSQIMRGPMKFSAHKFKRHLDVEMLRGDLMNICLSVEIFEEFHSAGIIRFFDDLIGNWLKSPNNCFMTASEVLKKYDVATRLSVPVTVNWRGEFEPAKREGLATLTDVQACPPGWLRFQRQVDASKTLYRLYKNVLRTEDESLYRDFSRLTALDYLLEMSTQIPPLVGIVNKRADDAEVRSFYGYFLTVLEDLSIRVREKLPQSLALEPGEMKEMSKDAASEEAKDEPTTPPEEDFSVEVHRIVRKKTPETSSMPKADEDDGEIKINFGARKDEPGLDWESAVLDDDMEVLAYSEDDLVRYFAKKMNLDIEEVGDDVPEEDVSEEEQILAERLVQKQLEMKEDLDSLTEAELVMGQNKDGRVKKRHRFKIG